MKPRPEVVDPGTTRLRGNSHVLTVAADLLDLSLQSDCLALLIEDADGIRCAFVERWATMSSGAARRQRRAELCREAQEELEQVRHRMRGTGGGLEG